MAGIPWRRWKICIRYLGQGGWRRCLRIPCRRAVAVVVALSLWVSTGGLTASEVSLPMKEDGFGEIHWYPVSFVSEER